MAMRRRPKRFIVTVKILDIIRPWDFHRGDLLLGWISSAEGGVNGYVWLKLVERYCCYSSVINRHLHFTFVGNASSPACGRVARVPRSYTWSITGRCCGDGAFSVWRGGLLWTCTCQMLSDMICISPAQPHLCNHYDFVLREYNLNFHLLISLWNDSFFQNLF